jgi:protein archease
VKGTYRQFDHTGDVGIEAEAPDEPSLYACCASALFEIVAGASPVEARESLRIEVTADDRELLLVRWLRELLYFHEVHRYLFRDFDVTTAEEQSRFSLAGTATGETFDPARHSLRTEIKAVTHHQIHVTMDAGGMWRARIVFDI